MNIQNLKKSTTSVMKSFEKALSNTMEAINSCHNSYNHTLENKKYDSEDYMLEVDFSYTDETEDEIKENMRSLFSGEGLVHESLFYRLSVILDFEGNLILNYYDTAIKREYEIFGDDYKSPFHMVKITSPVKFNSLIETIKLKIASILSEMDYRDMGR